MNEIKNKPGSLADAMAAVMELAKRYHHYAQTILNCLGLTIDDVANISGMSKAKIKQLFQAQSDTNFIQLGNLCQSLLTNKNTLINIETGYMIYTKIHYDFILDTIEYCIENDTEENNKCLNYINACSYAIFSSRSNPQRLSYTLQTMANDIKARNFIRRSFLDCYEDAIDKYRSKFQTFVNTPEFNAIMQVIIDYYSPSAVDDIKTAFKGNDISFSFIKITSTGNEARGYVHCVFTQFDGCYCCEITDRMLATSSSKNKRGKIEKSGGVMIRTCDNKVARCDKNTKHIDLKTENVTSIIDYLVSKNYEVITNEEMDELIKMKGHD